MFRLFVVITFILSAVYAYQMVKRLTSYILFKVLYWSLVLCGLFYFVFIVAVNVREVLDNPKKSIDFAIFFAFYIFLLSSSFIMFIEDIGRVLTLQFKKSKRGIKKKDSRRKFMSKLALGAGALPFSGLIYGVFLGRYNFKAYDYTLFFDDLPPAFDGYKIVHISDFHCGGLDNRGKVEYAVDLIKQQKGDIILFTGDFVDEKSSEINEWKSLFSSLKAKDGKFSILGNHDYGHYFRWNSPQEKEEDFEQLKSLQKEMGFDLLLDENRLITRKGQRLCLIGVEYWGNSEPKEKGDLEMAIEGIHDDDFKILMSHDPDHWRHVVLNHKKHFQLTLAGHTHGFQFGLEIPGKFRWTPIRSPFKYWVGMYKEYGQYLNVNRGFGYTGFPARIGIWPEVSVITLKNNNIKK